MNDTPKSPYPDYDVLNKWASPSWNDRTREVVARRLRDVPERRFFTEEEYALLEAVAGRLIPQPDRSDDSVPIAPWIDRRLHEDASDGYRQESMPRQREAWRRGLRAIDAESRLRHGVPFLGLDPQRQDALLRRLQQGDVEAEDWGGLPAEAFFGDVLEAVVGVYYAHPAAWSEIGFGGPASPRGYVRLGPDERDPWEASEHRAP